MSNEPSPNSEPAPSPKPKQKAKTAPTKKAAITKPAIAKNKPERFLPTERITFKRQLELLRAYAAASGPTNKPVTNKDVASFVKMTDSTTSMGNAFFTQNGFLAKVGGGFVPAPEVVAFHRANDWNAETASQKLGPLVARTWFADALLPRLSLNALEEEQAVVVLAEAATADPKYRINLKLLIDYLEASGLVSRDGTLVRLNRIAAEAASAEAASQPGAALNGTEQVTPPTSRGAIATTFSAPTEASIRFQIDVNVKMDEMGTWTPDRISAFFTGIGQVMAAKGAMEKKVTGE